MNAQIPFLLPSFRFTNPATHVLRMIQESDVGGRRLNAIDYILETLNIFTKDNAAFVIPIKK